MFTTIFYQPIFNLLVLIYNYLPGHDMGLVIIVLTILIKLALLPLSKSSIKGQKALQELQPKIDELKTRYADNKEEMGKAMLLLYKDNKVNPFSSCLPLIIQLPFLIAVFQVFRDGLSAKALNLVYPFLTKPETIQVVSFGFLDLSKPNYILAALSAGAQFYQAKMMMVRKPEIHTAESKDEDMAAIMNKQMMYMMPAMTFFIGITLPSGLSLYWLVSTLLAIWQQYYIFHKKAKVSENI